MLLFQGHLDDTSSLEACYVFLLLFFHIGVLGYNILPSGGILFLGETQEQLWGLVNVTRASINTGVRGKRVRSQFWVNCLFNIRVSWCQWRRIAVCRQHEHSFLITNVCGWCPVIRRYPPRRARRRIHLIGPHQLGSEARICASLCRIPSGTVYKELKEKKERRAQRTNSWMEFIKIKIKKTTSFELLGVLQGRQSSSRRRLNTQILARGHLWINYRSDKKRKHMNAFLAQGWHLYLLAVLNSSHCLWLLS